LARATSLVPCHFNRHPLTGMASSWTCAASFLAPAASGARGSSATRFAASGGAAGERPSRVALARRARMPSRPFASVVTRCAQPSSEADAPASPEATSSSKRTIDALSALLGEDDAEEEERRREEEADRARAELADRVEAEKLARGERLQAFRRVSTSALRQQQLQMLFLDMPIFPEFVRDRFLDEPALPSAAGAPALEDLPECEWFDVELPSDSDLTEVMRRAAPPDADAPPSSLFFEDLTPEYVAYEGERLPGEFSIPVVPYPYACVPGSLARLNLFEPRWLTLFAKLVKPPDAPPGSPLVLEGTRGRNRIDLSRNEMVRAYESGDDRDYDIVPGAGRMDEIPFEGTGAFGALYRRSDGKVAGVGVAMNIVATDVVVDGKLFSVYAEGGRRFRVLRVRQVNPYLVVDAVPIEDEREIDIEREGDDKRLDGNVVEECSATSAANASDADETSPAAPRGAASALARTVKRLIAADPYYSDAVGLGEAWTDAGLRANVESMSDFEVANATLYAKPELALRAIASVDPEQRRRAIEGSVRGMEAALAAGITPRRARLLNAAAAFGALFTLGFCLAYVRDFIEAHFGNAGAGF
jgi:hypothetical protein